ncbi:glycoside hydrolase family 16 protein [Micromonospora coxensis]|uniref:Glycosyl hydrolases family 16 n=1 Tax=Micromonospora coxensis TaxID=356852 RepID=A0A1C5K1Q3_9ACTN|nr:glycoside hydrolase family 16 protein [Micromonospora coxensis]SCG76740.1 Glycosyl hydrolases family 16 [Micromonospora coxensis]
MRYPHHRRLLAGAVLLGTGLGALTAVATPPAPVMANPPSSAYTLVFSDEFNGTAVDTTKWHYRTDVKANSAQRPENVSVAGGYLNVHHRKESYAGKSYTAGGVVSKTTFRYGYYESRLRVTDGAGWHGAFWLQAGDGSTTYPAEQRTEIDIFENDSVNPTGTTQNVHLWAGSGVKAAPSKNGWYGPAGFDVRQWHTYGVDWSETSVKFYVDGQLTRTTSYLPSENTHDYVAMWLTSIGYGALPDDSKLPSSTQFDWVRYWLKDAYVDNDGPAAYGYTESGSWLNSTLSGWTVDSTTRYAGCSVAGATATWRPNLRAAGTYEVFYHNIVQSNGDPAARLTVVHSSGTTPTTVNGRSGSTGWVSLGQYHFGAGTAGYARLTGSGGGCARADAVKFVRR